MGLSHPDTNETPVMETSSDLEAYMYYLSRHEEFQTIKPYSMRYPPPDGIPQSNIRREKHHITLKDMRSYARPLDFDTCGFDVLDMQSQLELEDFADEARIVNVYTKEIASALKERLGARHVFVMDHAVRRRDPSFPISTGKDFDHDQPTAMAHIDFSYEAAIAMIQTLYKDNAEEILKHRWQIVNVWKPLAGPVRDWPLGICDAQSVDFDNDTMPGDIVFPEWATENLQVHFNKAHDWYYLADQDPSEILIFKSVDSAMPKNGANPHAGFFNKRARSNDPPRQSIDCRAFVFYADLHPWPDEIGDIFQGHL